MNSIARILKENGIKTIRGNAEWNVSSIRTILINEKYIGDAMAQKTFTTDYLTKERKENRGELQKYYMENAHEAIIPREIFYKVQEELNQRANVYKKSNSKQETEVKGKPTGKYALSKITVCKECGCEYRRQIWSKYGEKKVVWRCENRLRNGTRYCKNSPTIEECVLHRAVLHAINRVLENKEDFVQTFRQNVVKVLTNEAGNSKKYENEKQELQKKLVELIIENATQDGDTKAFDERYKEIANKIEALNMMQIQEQNGNIEGNTSHAKIQAVDSFMKNTGGILTDYDNKLVRRLIQNIHVVNGAKIEVVFKSGIVVEERIEVQYKTSIAEI